MKISELMDLVPSGIHNVPCLIDGEGMRACRLQAVTRQQIRLKPSNGIPNTSFKRLHLSLDYPFVVVAVVVCALWYWPSDGLRPCA